MIGFNGSHDQICHSKNCDSYNVSSENFVLDQLIIPQLIFFFILITYLVDIVFDIVRRNSVLALEKKNLKGLS